ncbi:PA0069 family radical SAM protein [Pseudohongiella spirulinae]|uniref:Radical SAM domain-containing protein n=1 Tax=Pseudohongiella spirulinae TaxID=1249552 RepID=A0A0S2KAG8_9GAMM|nr:PA0069 family radical SAM protein [Pseudohongiella spirulinae]ALO45075.1 Radical SAM domain-containing protein [Pseudohongiella spirulinae]
MSDQSPIKGRGATTNMQGRFEHQVREVFDDGWERHNDDTDPASRPPQTQITEEHAKSILTRNQSPDLPFHVSLNPYRGCEHGCIYCFARPTHSYLELSPGLDFETRLFAKVNAADLLRRELASPAWKPEPIALGVNTDAYQPCERRYGITRQILEVARECRQPIGVITKSALVERDIDILSDLAQQQLTVVALTITTLDHSIARTLEPRAASPTRRLKIMEKLAAAGIPVSVSVAPIIPFVTDHDLEKILKSAAEAGAQSAGYVMLRLPWEVSPLFQQWLQAYFPDRAERVMNRVRDLSGGKDYQAEFGRRMTGEGIWADLIRKRFDGALNKHRLKERRSADFAGLDCARFRRPLTVPSGSTENTPRQIDMF